MASSSPLPSPHPGRRRGGGLFGSNPLTGSIGVVAGKPVLDGLWDELGVSWGTVERGANASMFSLNEPYGPLIWNEIPAKAFSNWANAHDAYGDFNELEAATLDDTAAFSAAHYSPAQGTAVVAGDFDPGRFRHRAFFDREARWIEMRLVSEREQTVRLPAIDLTFELETGEEILTRLLLIVQGSDMVAMYRCCGVRSVSRFSSHPDQIAYNWSPICPTVRSMAHLGSVPSSTSSLMVNCGPTSTVRSGASLPGTAEVKPPPSSTFFAPRPFPGRVGPGPGGLSVPGEASSVAASPALADSSGRARPTTAPSTAAAVSRAAGTHQGRAGRSRFRIAASASSPGNGC